jgi:hypothetical protein
MEHEEFGALLTIIEDATADAAERPATSEDASNDWKTIVGNVALGFSRMNVYTAGAEAAVSLYRHFTNDKEHGPSLQVVRSSIARTHLRFPPGHPRVGVVYARHPANPSLYYPAATFHRKVFEHKLAEACYLLAALGARDIRIEHKRGWGRDFAANISVPLEAPGSSAGATVGSTSGNADQMLMQARLVGHDSPVIPEDMVWFEHEPTWTSMARMRIHAGMKEFSLNLAYEDDFQVNAALKASAAKAELEIGGKFVDHVATVWTINGTFGPA